MVKKISALWLIVILCMALVSCGKVIEPPLLETATEETTTEPETEETTTEETTTEETTTEPETTQRPTTTKMLTTKVLTTKAMTEKRTARTQAIVTEVNEKYRTESRTENAVLKYGVTVARSIEVTYRILSNGKKEVVSETEKAAVYDRMTYNADYNDLLPAARANKSKYSGYINEVLRLTNQMRAEVGLGPLTLDSKLTEQANVRAEEVAWSGKHSHMRPGTKGKYTTIFRENGYTTGTSGENLGWGYSSPSGVCSAWKASQGHYENIINPKFKKIGIGVAADCDSGRNLVWVQHFYGQ